MAALATEAQCGLVGGMSGHLLQSDQSPTARNNGPLSLCFLLRFALYGVSRQPAKLPLWLPGAQNSPSSSFHCLPHQLERHRAATGSRYRKAWAASHKAGSAVSQWGRLLLPASFLWRFRPSPKTQKERLGRQLSVRGQKLQLAESSRLVSFLSVFSSG